MLGDEVMAAELIDRLLHHCHIVNIRGNSYRVRAARPPRSSTRYRREAWRGRLNMTPVPAFFLKVSNFRLTLTARPTQPGAPDPQATAP